MGAIPWWCWILAVVVVEGTVVLVVGHGRQPAADTDVQQYARYADNLLKHGVFSEAVAPPYYPGVERSPGYPVFLALFDWIGGSPFTAMVRLAQFALLGTTAVLVGWIGRRVAGPNVGSVGAVFCATYLPFLWFAAYDLTEVLGGFGVTTVVALVVLARRRDHPSIWAAAGFALALTTYVRPEYILLPVLIAAILLVGQHAPWRTANRWKRCLVFSAAFLVALVPWTIRNASVTGGRLVPLATNSGSSLLESADQYAGFISYKLTPADWQRFLRQEAVIDQTPPHFDVRAQIQVDGREQSAARRIFASLSLGTIVSSLPRRLFHLWGTADVPPPGRWQSVAHRLAVVQYVGLGLLGLAGLVIRRRRLLSDWPLWMTAVYLSPLHLVFGVESRYTLPARAPLMIYPAIGACALFAWFQRRLPSHSSGPGGRSSLARTGPTA